jgi:hypothetical protein
MLLLCSNIILFVDTHYTEGHSHTLIVHIVTHSTFPQYLRTHFTTTITSVLITTTDCEYAYVIPTISS